VRYRHLFFDLDGTLWDLKRNTREALLQLFEKYSTPFKGVDFNHFFARYHFHNDHVWALYRDAKIEKEVLRTIRFERTFQECGMSATPAFVNEFADAFLHVCPRLPHLLPGTIDLLEAIKDKYQLHIITNGFQEVQGFKMEAGKLTPYFNHLVYSEGAGMRKPHPEIFQYAFELTGANAEESLMIGDDWEADILGARNAGMDQAFLTTTEDMLHELSSSTRDRPSRHIHKPTFTLHRIDDLLKVL